MIPDFQTALVDGDLDALRRCPKGDLHNHAILGGDRRFLARRTGRDIAPLDHKLSSMAEMHAWTRDVVGGLFDGREGRLLAFEATLVQARGDGVTRLEIGEDVWAIGLFDDLAEALTRRLQRLHATTAPAIEWIAQLGLSRHCPIAALERWLAPFLALGFYQTLDLSGDELAQPIEAFKPLFRRAKDAGLSSRRMSANGARRTTSGEPSRSWSSTRSNTELPPPICRPSCGSSRRTAYA